tara:strand:- start:1183 stop:1584 length:402 start_codon:yes stop_codon:yes gene_type:complete
MILYNWQKIFEISESNPFTIFIIFRMLTAGLIPDNKYDKLYEFSKANFSGDSFMLHPDILLFNAYKYEYSDIAQYIALCSLRPLSDYQATGKIDLSLEEVDIDPNLFKDNSLLRIEDDIIHFIYEEVPKEKLH